MEKQKLLNKLVEFNQLIENVDLGDIVIECNHDWRDILLLFAKSSLKKSTSFSAIYSFYTDIDYYNTIQWCPYCHSLRKIQKKFYKDK